jgi:hypothetical protein
MAVRPRLAHEHVAPLRLLGWAVLLLNLAVLDPLEILRAHSFGDYASFHAAGVAIARGDSPYSVDDFREASLGLGFVPHPYLYPPLLACVLYPLTFLGAWPARILWELFSIAAALGTLRLLLRWIDENATDRAEEAKTAVVFVAAFFWPLRECAWMGQVNVIVLFFILCWWLGRTRSRWAGAWLGVAIAIKMSPALLVLCPLTQRRWREAAVVAGAAGLLVTLSCAVMGSSALVFPEAVLGGFLPGHAYHSFTIPIAYYGNNSLAALASALTGNPGGDGLRLGLGALVLQVALVLAMIGTWLVARRRMPPSRSFAALLVIMVLTPTYAWEHHLVFALFAVTVLVTSAAGRDRGWRVATAWVVVVWLCAPHTALVLPEALASRLGTLALMPKLLPLLGLFVLMVADGIVRRDASPLARKETPMAAVGRRTVGT